MPARFSRPLAAARDLAQRDERFARLVELAGPPRIVRYESSFETLARAIAYQQLNGTAARTIWGRVLALFPEGGFEPAAVLRRRDPTLRKAGLSAAKTASLRDLARHVADGRLDLASLPRLSDDEVIERLTQVRGIGPWSAHMHLLFALGRKDVWPTGDYGVRAGLARFLGLAETPTEKACLPLGDPYRPHRSVFAWYMWRIHDVEPWQ